MGRKISDPIGERKWKVQNILSPAAFGGLAHGVLQLYRRDTPGLLDQVEGEIAQVSADGAYDSHGCHAAIAERGARATIPPREGAVAWGGDHPRDAILKEIEAKGSRGWKNESGYHRRSIAENMMYRLKQLGDSLYSRTFERQVNEAHVRVAILNTFTYLGMPESVRVGQIAPAA
jgi:transposase